jgi:hypothetical protein
MTTSEDVMKQEEQRVPERGPRQRKRPYAAPRLTEYGSVAKLTQGGGSLQGDGGSTFKRTCL